MWVTGHARLTQHEDLVALRSRWRLRARAARRGRGPGLGYQVWRDEALVDERDGLGEVRGLLRGGQGGERRVGRV
jgi:hypothetical protein